MQQQKFKLEGRGIREKANEHANAYDRRLLTL